VTALLRQLQRDEPAPPWGIFTGLLAFAVAFIFIALAGVALASFVFPPQSPSSLIAGWLIGGVLVVGYITATQRTPQARAALRLDDPSLPVLIAFSIGLAAAVVLDLVAIPFTGAILIPPEFSIYTASPGAFGWVLAGLLVLAVQPLAEELVFRGVMYPALRAAQRVWVAIFVSAAFYGVFHQLVYPHPAPGAAGAWYSLIEPLLLGLVLGVIRAGSGSTRAAVAAHAGIGAFALLKALLILGGTG
jgi:uncharacterized protein